MSKITYEKVIVNTVAKVGSANFLKCKYSQSTKIYHGHSLLTLQDTLNNKSNCLIIIGIRNPIERNLSYLFQTYNNKSHNDVKTKKNNYKGELCYIPNLTRYATPEVIIDLYFKQKYHNTFNEWFEEFLNITKITNFDKDKGVDFYKFPNNNTIMIYTLEKLTANYKYIKEQLGIVSNIENRNNSDYRSYSKIYEQVKQKIVYKKEYLDNLLNTDIMRLFYNENDINFFYSKYQVEDNYDLEAGKAETDSNVSEHDDEKEAIEDTKRGEEEKEVVDIADESPEDEKKEDETQDDKI